MGIDKLKLLDALNTAMPTDAEVNTSTIARATKGTLTALIEQIRSGVYDESAAATPAEGAGSEHAEGEPAASETAVNDQ